MRINYVVTDDWEGIYIDGILIDSGHSIKASDLLEILEEFKLITYKQEGIEQDYMEDMGDLPKHYKNIEKDQLYDNM